MPCTTSDEFIASGTAQMDLAGLTGAARTQANLTLQLQNPYNPKLTGNYTGPINTTLPYFLVGADGCPLLFIPTPADVLATGAFPPLPTPTITSPSAPTPVNVTATFNSPAETLAGASPQPGIISVPSTQPCPEGFVESGAPQPSVMEQVQGQILAGFPSVATEAGGCKPTIVLSAPLMTTKDDFLVVSISTIFQAFGFTTGTVPLTVAVRLMTCSGAIQVMETTKNFTYTKNNGATQGEICIPLTDGYLLSVVASGAPFCTQPGEVWVQGEIRANKCSGTPVYPLFSGYMVDQSFIAWPGGRQDIWGQGNGATRGFNMGTSPSPVRGWVIEAGMKVRLSQISISLTTNATASNRSISLTWFPFVDSANIVYSSTVTQPASKTYTWVFANGIDPGLHDGTVDPGGGITLDGIVGIPIPSDIIGNVDAAARCEINGMILPGDTFNYAGVLYEAWAEPPDVGF